MVIYPPAKAIALAIAGRKTESGLRASAGFLVSV